MRFLPLVLKNLLRRKTRTVFTLLSVLVAFALFGVLATIRVAFSMGVEVAGADRLVTIHKVSLIMPLPIAYQQQIRAVNGVTALAHATWFGGIYQDPNNFFPQMAVAPEEWLALYPEYLLPDDQKKAWLQDRTGAIAGRAIAQRFGWKVGDRIPIQGTIFRRPDGRAWEFTIDGIYDGAREGVDTTGFFFHYAYLDETRGFWKGLVGWYVIRVGDPQRSAEIAGQIDALFANSAYETKTTTEKAFAQSFANQVGDIGTITTAVLIAVFFTILLVAGNTMAQSIREQTRELALLKTLGYSNGLVLTLVLVESVVLSGVGGGLGLAIAWWFVKQGDPTNGLLPAFFFPPRDLALGIVLALLLGLASGILPAVSALRLKIADALRKA